MLQVAVSAKSSSAQARAHTLPRLHTLAAACCLQPGPSCPDSTGVQIRTRQKRQPGSSHSVQPRQVSLHKLWRCTTEHLLGSSRLVQLWAVAQLGAQSCLLAQGLGPYTRARHVHVLGCNCSVPYTYLHELCMQGKRKERNSTGTHTVSPLKAAGTACTMLKCSSLAGCLLPVMLTTNVLRHTA